MEVARLVGAPPDAPGLEARREKAMQAMRTRPEWRDVKPARIVDPDGGTTTTRSKNRLFIVIDSRRQ